MKNNKLIIERLTALWALNESGLGGFLHVFSSPFTGILVGGIAILLISLIAWYADNVWRSVMKALLIVLVIKAAVSPHSPLTAYLAVSFQGVLGAFLFANFSWKGMAPALLGILTFLESALQKLLVLSIIYGAPLWQAVNSYGAWVVEKFGYTEAPSATLVLVSAYLLLYAVCGLLAGFFIQSIIKLINRRENHPEFIVHFHQTFQKKTKKNSAFRGKFLFVWGLTIALILAAFAIFGGELGGWQKAIYIVLRSFLVLMLWYLVAGPVLLKLLRRYLAGKGAKYREDIHNALDLFPYFRSIISYTWKSTKTLKGYARFKHFIAYSILYSIHFKIKPDDLSPHR